MNRKTLSITHGAITAALTVLLILADRLVAGFIMSFLPIPLIVYGMYYSVKESFVVYVVTVLLVMIIPGQLPTTILMINYGLLAILYIAIFKTKLPNKLKILVIYLGNLLNYFIMMRFFGAFFGLEFSTLIQEYELIFKNVGTEVLYYMAIVGVLFTAAMETFIIYLAAKQVTYLMKRHRK